MLGPTLYCPQYLRSAQGWLPLGKRKEKENVKKRLLRFVKGVMEGKYMGQKDMDGYYAE